MQINNKQYGWFIKIDHHSQSKIKGFEDYVPLIHFKDTISVPKIGIDDTKVSTNKRFTCGILIISVNPTSRSTEITHKLMGESTDNDAHKSTMDTIKIIRSEIVNGNNHSKILEEIEYTKCMVNEMTLEGTESIRTYTIIYKKRLEKIHDYDTNGDHRGSARCEIDFDRGNSRHL
ncbi:hypothetical protein [Candidatus Gromoviella agglomerans]|uniref:hypothetical protein n=1 Tax=Candidatus Gromoviella agglomerans TaxID=2806609 RepID=UPI001E2DD90F|nr:hypothetical protein [Candidatus Gromoviella agglomerans]UFX98515.1 hypothetical protein Gromo_00425 [Candidatus Gromoviella agglomerans]